MLDEEEKTAVDGHGDPHTAPAYARAVEALFGDAYTLKFRSKKELGLISQPDWIDTSHVADAVRQPVRDA